jgi:hypothetical protein
MARKPVMAGKKDFELDDWEVLDEAPVITRVVAGRLPIDFDKAMAHLKSTKKPSAMKFLPVEFWTARGIVKEKNNPAANKDRVRRSLYSWQGKDKDKLKYTVAFSDQYDDKKKYTGVNVYFQPKP